MINLRLRGFLLVGTTACMFGLGVVLAKLITGVLNSFLISFLALAGGGALVTVYLWARRQPVVPPLSRSAWGQMLLLAFVGTALPLILVVEGF
ncbi:MAG TPA: hypothetical protein VGT44_01560, partial [Ktedonobacteraceae bacterium]|nr:hypothetical protein [Ktedonobacteraceae bacterium]